MAEDRCKDGFLVPALGRIADWLNDHWLMRWRGCVFRSLKDPKPADTERYVVGWFVVGFVISLAVCLLYDRVTPVRWVVYPLATLIYLIAALRGVEIIARTTTVKDVISIQRSLVLAAINYVELMLWFGLIYALNYHCHHGASRPVTAFYFSIITQLTIGYGDVYAMGWLRIIAAAQGLIGALFVIVVLGRAVSASPPPSPPEPQ
jgi:Ion channel